MQMTILNENWQELDSPMEDENLHLKFYYLKKDLSMNPLGYTFVNDGKSSHQSFS